MMTEPHPSYVLAVEAAKNQTELAAILGVKPQLISWRWKNGKPISGEDAVIVERELGIPRQKLRPDLYSDMIATEGRTQ